MKNLHLVASILLIVGGLNWLLLGLFGWEIGQLFGGSEAIVSRIIYILVGISAVIEIFKFKGGKKSEAPASGGNPMNQMGGQM